VSMIGSLVHYNNAGSRSLAIITDVFTYRGPSRTSVHYVPGDTLVSLEWIKISGSTPRELHPDYDVSMNSWPENYVGKKWYNLRHFKIISSATP
jgi:hypothetical protein